MPVWLVNLPRQSSCRGNGYAGDRQQILICGPVEPSRVHTKRPLRIVPFSRSSYCQPQVKYRGHGATFSALLRAAADALAANAADAPIRQLATVLWGLGRLASGSSPLPNEVQTISRKTRQSRPCALFDVGRNQAQRVPRWCRHLDDAHGSRMRSSRC